MSELEPCCNSDCGDYEMEDEMNELEPCPFCGTSVVGIEHDGLYRWVECGNMDCNAAGKVFTFLIDADADHIVANNWNTRPIEDELRAEIERKDKRVSELDTELLMQKSLVFAREQDLNELHIELNQAEIINDALRAELASKDEELAELNDRAVFIQFENEDELPADISGNVYDVMFRCSHVDGVRLFPYIEENGQKYFLVMLKEEE